MNMEPTIEFRLITFPDVEAAPLSTARIAGAALKDRIVFARTRSGKRAKFQAVLNRTTLDITRLTLYDPQGTVLPLPAQSFSVRSGRGCDLENGAETTSLQRDFTWIARRPPPRLPGRGGNRPRPPGPIPALVPDPQARFAPWVDFEALGYADMGAGPWSADRVEGSALRHQILFCRTGRSRATVRAKLLVEIDGVSLVVKRLVVRTTRGVVLDASNIRVRQSEFLDLRTGNVGTTGDLKWEVPALDRWFLVPQGAAMISYPSHYRFAKYLPLLRDPAIQGAMYFSRVTPFSSKTYEFWEPHIRLQLDEYLYLLDTGRPLPLAGPPAVTFIASSHYIEAKEGHKAYLSHVAQSLWVDANGRVRWALSRNPAELEYLFDSRRFFTQAATQYRFDNGAMGLVTAWNAQAAYAFLVANALIGPDAFSTIRKIADWCRSNLKHITGYTSDPNGPFASIEDQLRWYYGYEGWPPVERVLVPAPGKPHITVGCWGTSALFAAVLRTVNIPVRHGRTTFADGSHSRPEFFGAAQNLAHGDDPFGRLAGVGHHTPPIDVIFYTDVELAAKIDQPTLLPGKTVGETATVNYTRKFGDIAIQYKTDYLLGARCLDLQNNAPPTVTYSRLWSELHAAYTDAELTQIAADCDLELAALGGCSQIPPI